MHNRDVINVNGYIVNSKSLPIHLQPILALRAHHPD
jgi:hypothetical protein